MSDFSQFGAGGWEATEAQTRRETDREQLGFWNGRGDAPSREAAVEWAISKGVPKAQAEKIVGSSKKAIATSARRIVQQRRTEIATQRERAAGKRPQAAAAAPMDADGDGQITVADVQAQGDGAADDILGDIPLPGAASTRGAPLWPFDTSGMSDSEIAGITVANKTTLPNNANPFGKKPKAGERVGARYHAGDALSPLRWSPEQRADLQRVMHGLGLYGDKKIRLGTWTGVDQDVFTAVLEYSNVEGSRWFETIAGWRKAGLPPELADAVKQAQPKKPTIQVTNPVDIRQAAQEVSRELTGTRDDAFATAAVGPYQGMESAAQAGAYGDQEGGGGGTVTQAPSMGSYLEDKLRREQPIEVDGYQFLGQFQNFLSMMGVS